MSPFPRDSALLEQLSALADGELDCKAAAATCEVWDREASARACWHTYQLIGDVLRSQDLAADPARDAAFLGALRERLALERAAATGVTGTVVGSERAGAVALPTRTRSRAPVPAVVASWWGSRRWGWPGLVASAALATFAAIAVTLAMLPPPHPVGLASAPSKPGLPATADDPAQRASLLEPGSAVTTSTLAGGTPVAVVRDPRLDAYLAAHKQFAGSSALGVPSAFLRSATVDSKGP